MENSANGTVPAKKLPSPEIGAAKKTAAPRILRIALALMLVGAAMAGGAWMTGARGVAIGWDGGPVVIPAGPRETFSVEMPPDGVRMLDVRSSSARISIKQGNSDSIVVEFVGAEPSYAVNSGKLEITANPPGMFTFTLLGIGFSGFGEESVTVWLPPVVLASVQAHTSSGRISVENIAAYEGHFSSSSGRITLAGAVFEELAVTSASGRQEISDSAWTRLAATSFSGAVVIRGARPQQGGESRVSASSGRVDMEVAMPHEMFDYSVESSSGRIRINDRNVAASVSRRGEHRIAINTKSGSIALNFRN